MSKTKFKEGDKVYTFDMFGKQYNGAIHKNTEHPNVSEWYIKYDDDGEEYSVLNINEVYKQNKL